MNNLNLVADMHIHSRDGSDGRLKYSQIAWRISKKNKELENKGKRLQMVCYADHDMIDFNMLEQGTGIPKGIEQIPAVEIHANEPDNCIKKIELLVYFPFVNLDQLKESNLVKKMEQRNQAQELHNMQITEELARAFQQEGIALQPKTTPRSKSEFAQEVMDSQNRLTQSELIYKTVQQALAAVENKSKGPIEGLPVGSIDELIELALEAKGIPVIAHPGKIKIPVEIPIPHTRATDSSETTILERSGYLLSSGKRKRTSEFRSYLRKKVKKGLKGIEVDYPYDQKALLQSKKSEYSDKIVNYWRKFALDMKILALGGSDFHEDTRCYFANTTIPYKNVTKMRTLATKLFK